MASNISPRYDHLDAFAGREVVYCHQCRREWYRDESGLICPHCDGEATEIVSPHQLVQCMFFAQNLLLTSPQVTAENDPRIMPGLGSDYDNNSSHLHDTDSDPEEADIEDHVAHGPPGMFGRQTIFRSLDGPGPGSRPRANPNNGEDIIRRFTEMLGDMGGGQVVGRSGPETLFSGGNGGAGGPQRVSYQRFSGPGFTSSISRVTITSGGGGPSRTIVSDGNRVGGEDPFQSYGSPFPPTYGPPRITLVSFSGANRSPRVFGEIFGQMGPPPMDRNNPNAPGGLGGPGGPGGNGPLDMPAALHHLLAAVLNPNAVHGDGVYTQEALDRIITNLMEANPQSNAPPPASAETIAKLPRKKLDEQMLGPELKGECTICIDEMTEGDEALVLPCKHWFHEECAVLWLKEHNTCPICRAPIEGDAAGRPNAPQSSSQPQPPSPSQSQSQSQDPSASSSRPEGVSERRRTNLRARGAERLASIQADGGPYDWRNPARRNSNSPPQASSQPSRVRSPSPTGRRSQQSERSRDSGSSGGGPLHWLRDQFSRERRRS
jgi:hypothetical protein